MRLQYIYDGKEREPHPFHVKSDWNPPVQPSVALETFLEEVKIERAEIQFKKPKPNLTPGELQTLKQLSRDKTIVLKKADKGTTSIDPTSTPHRPHIDPTSTPHRPHIDLHRPYIDPTSTPHGPSKK